MNNPGQVNNGIKGILNIPKLYNFFIRSIGGYKSRKEFVDTYINPFRNMRILDIGCGTASILTHLPSQIFYVGVDLSEDYILSAKLQWKGRGVFYASRLNDFKDLNEKKFDCVLGLGLLHHLEDEEAINFFRYANDHVSNDGRIITADPCYHKNQNPIARFIIDQDRGRCVRTKNEYQLLAKKYVQNVESIIRHDRLRIPYTHHIMICRKNDDSINCSKLG